MSLINKMLQELDKRHAAQDASPAATARLAQNIRPVVSARVGSEFFWWLMALLMLASMAWLAWVMWQLMPRSVVNEIALRSAPRPAAVALAQPPLPEATAAAPNAEEVIPPLNETKPPSARTGEPQLDMLKLATEISTPIPPRPAKPPAPQLSREASRPGSAKPAAKPPVSSPPVAAPIAPLTRNQATPKPKALASADTVTGRIERRVTSTPRERAESEYRRSVNLVNQGRVSEGMDGLRAALAIDGGFEVARQTLVALLIEQRRLDAAVVQLQQGLDLNPRNSAFAMLLARIMVDRQNVAGAAGLLEKHAPAAGTHADYHAFQAALYQRLGRHAEAIAGYRTALKLSPQSGAWWVGLGISEEASNRRKEAAEAFRQARATGSLGGDLLTYVDQRLKQLP